MRPVPPILALSRHIAPILDEWSQMTSRTRNRRPSAPAHLSPAAKRWYKDVAALFVSFDPHEIEQLRLAAECLSRIEEARKALADHGLLIPDRYGGLRLNPAHDVLNRERRAFIQLCRELQLSEDEATAPSRPPRVPGRYGR
jgi:phage terminase small subunit